MPSSFFSKTKYFKYIYLYYNTTNSVTFTFKYLLPVVALTKYKHCDIQRTRA